MLDNRNFERIDLTGKIFKGTVVDNNDPLKLGRLKVFIDSIFSGQLKNNAEYLPWIMPVNSYSSTNDQCNINVPDIDSECYVIFPTNDAYSGIYISSVPNVAQEFLKDYPYCYGRIDRSGTLFIANTSNDMYMIYHSSGTCLTVDGFGKVKIQVANSGDANPNAKSENPYGISLEVIGDINLDCTRNVNMHCKSFTVDATDSIIMKTKELQFNSYNMNVRNNAGINISTATYSLNGSSDITLAGNSSMKLSGTSMLSLYGSTVTLGNSVGGMLSDGVNASRMDGYEMKKYKIKAVGEVTQDGQGNVSTTDVEYDIMAFDATKTPYTPGTEPQQLPVNITNASQATTKNIIPKPNRVRQAFKK